MRLPARTIGIVRSSDGWPGLMHQTAFSSLEGNTKLFKSERWAICSSHFLFKPLDLCSDRFSHSMFNQINLSHRNVKTRCHFFGSPLFVYVEVEDLILLWLLAALHVRDCRVEQVLLPFVFPNRIELLDCWIRHLLCRVGSCVGLVRSWTRLEERP